MLLLLTVCWFLKTQTTASDKDCKQNWFGGSCEYMCHCKSNSCDAVTRGECSECIDDYFGPSCQYLNLANTEGALTNPPYLRDTDVTTCNTHRNAHTVKLTLQKPLRFFWFRLIVNNASVLQHFTVHFNPASNNCTNERRYNVSNLSVDVSCDITEPVKLLILQGAVAPHVCSIQISGGRNLVLKQRVKQSTTLNNQISAAENAVDGNKNSDYLLGSCTSSNYEFGAEWNLTLSKPAVLYRIKVYNRNIDRYLLQGFTVETFNETVLIETIADTRFIKDVYDFTFSSVLPVTTVRIKAASDSFYLSMCEVEIFGESVCPDLLYGLECSKICKCKGHETCHVATGICAPGCPFGFHGFQCKKMCNPECQNERCLQVSGKCYLCPAGYKGEFCDRDCPTGTFGPSCEETCSKQCEDNCDPMDGGCKCKIGYAAPLCQVCLDGMYGEGCSNNCSSFCLDSKCNHVTGDCSNCNFNRSGRECEKCPEGVYGLKCAKKCSQFCEKNICDSATGECLGCIHGRTGKKCEVCPSKRYGFQCSHKCPENCANDVCNIATGLCSSCVRGYEGPNCDIEVSYTYMVYFVLAPILIAGGVAAICFCIRDNYEENVPKPGVSDPGVSVSSSLSISASMFSVSVDDVVL